MANDRMGAIRAGFKAAKKHLFKPHPMKMGAGHTPQEAAKKIHTARSKGLK